MMRLPVLIAALALLISLAPQGAAAQEESFLTVAADPAAGAFFTDAEGMTLYLFTRDTAAGESVCDGDCALNWPPLPPAESMALPPGVPGELAVIDRADGTQQVTYNDIPLYYYAADQAAGEINGQGRGGVWFVVAPGAAHGPYAPAPGEGTPTPAATLSVGFSEELGPFLTDAAGMTLYLFTKDVSAGESTCEGDCLENWPPVPAAESLVLPPGVPGELTAIERGDGSTQLAYNDIPLYFFAGDAAAGDTNGQDVGDVWYVVTPGTMHGDEPAAEAGEAEAEEEEMEAATPTS